MPARDNDIDKYDFFKDRETLDVVKENAELIGGFMGYAVYKKLVPTNYYWYSPKVDYINFYIVNVGNDWKNKQEFPVIMKLDTILKKKKFSYVDYVYVNRNYRGKNIAALFYHYLITKHNIKLVSGSNQSAGGEKIWKRLANLPNIKIDLVESENMGRKSKKAVKFDKKWEVDIAPNELKSCNICFRATAVKPYKMAA